MNAVDVLSTAAELWVDATRDLKETRGDSVTETERDRRTEASSDRNSCFEVLVY